LAALLAPVVGPTLGGWITDRYSWRWAFFINVPIGLLAFVACYLRLRDPDCLTEQRAKLERQPSSFDAVGLSLLIIVMVCWEVMTAGKTVPTCSVPLSTFFTTGSRSESTTAPTTQNQLVTCRPTAGNQPTECFGGSAVEFRVFHCTARLGYPRRCAGIIRLETQHRT
jgi:MFS family permease